MRASNALGFGLALCLLVNASSCRREAEATVVVPSTIYESWSTGARVVYQARLGERFGVVKDPSQSSPNRNTWVVRTSNGTGVGYEWALATYPITGRRMKVVYGTDVLSAPQLGAAALAVLQPTDSVEVSRPSTNIPADFVAVIKRGVVVGYVLSSAVAEPSL